MLLFVFFYKVVLLVVAVAVRFLSEWKCSQLQWLETHISNVKLVGAIYWLIVRFWLIKPEKWINHSISVQTRKQKSIKHNHNFMWVCGACLCLCSLCSYHSPDPNVNYTFVRFVSKRWHKRRSYSISMRSMVGKTRKFKIIFDNNMVPPLTPTKLN